MKKYIFSIFVIVAMLACKVDDNSRETVTGFSSNNTVTTTCAEEDNVNISIKGDIKKFTIEARHPAYDVGADNCAPDFSGCDTNKWEGDNYSFMPAIKQLYNDGITIVEAVTEGVWWQPNGMVASIDSGPSHVDIHYIRVYRKISGSNEWPQFFVLYQDGNARIIPHPPIGKQSVCFGSSVLIGPAEISERPIASILSVKYNSSKMTLTVDYVNGGRATIDLSSVDRTKATVKVTIEYNTSTNPFVTFRSMYVSEGNNDVSMVRWLTDQNVHKEESVIDFVGGNGSEWFFYRPVKSIHNVSAPDIKITIVE